jgi:hypothetical protein
MTFRDLLRNCNRDEVYQWIGRPHLGGEGASPLELERLGCDYAKVMETLLQLPTNNQGYRFAVRRRDAPRDDEFITWFYNPNYTLPSTGEAPWTSGGAGCESHQKSLGLLTVPWKCLIDAEVLHSRGLPAEVVVAEVLPAITILGFEEKTQEEIDAALEAFARDAADSLAVFCEG